MVERIVTNATYGPLPVNPVTGGSSVAESKLFSLLVTEGFILKGVCWERVETGCLSFLNYTLKLKLNKIFQLEKRIKYSNNFVVHIKGSDAKCILSEAQKQNSSKLIFFSFCSLISSQIMYNWSTFACARYVSSLFAWRQFPLSILGTPLSPLN